MPASVFQTNDREHMQCVSGDVERREGRGIGGELRLALGGVHVCAAQAPQGPRLLFKMKAFSRS